LDQDGTVDSDGDELIDSFEYLAGTNPNLFDSDYDGLPDYLEDNDVSLIDTTGNETLGDGVANLDEQELGTHPGLKDSDDDGEDDYQELFEDYTDPNDSLDPEYDRVAKLNLSGDDGYFRVANNSSLSLTSFGIAVYVNPESNDGVEEVILEKRGADNRINYSLVRNVDGTISFIYHRSLTGSERKVTSAEAVLAGIWSLITCELDNSQGIFRLTIYDLESTSFIARPRAESTIMGDPVTGRGPLFIGSGIPGSNSNAFNGMIDELSIWNSVFTGTEITDIQKLSINLVTLPSTLVAYYKFDDKGLTVEDFVDRNNFDLAAIPYGDAHIVSGLPLPETGGGIGGEIVDSDDDGLPDEAEEAIINALYDDGITEFGHVNPEDDFDNDGLTNLEEVLFDDDPDYDTDTDTDPVNYDTDGDGMADGWEVQFLLNPLSSADKDSDKDGDKLTNLVEYLGRDNKTVLADVDFSGDPVVWGDSTHPGKADSDEDGLGDKWEFLNNLDANDSAGDNGPDGDPDNDDLTNMQEMELSTNPHKADSDSDGLPDGWEIEMNLDPIIGTGENGADGDPDDDDLVNDKEYGIGTDPNSSSLGINGERESVTDVR